MLNRKAIDALPIRQRIQRAEVLGCDNRWYCSRCTGRPVHDEETLWRHFCKNGGAYDFAHRWNHAMSEKNRYYCSQHFGYRIEDEETLWDYYNAHRFDHRSNDSTASPKLIQFDPKPATIKITEATPPGRTGVHGKLSAPNAWSTSPCSAAGHRTRVGRRRQLHW